MAHLARFGSSSGAHQLLEHTGPEDAAAAVAWFTDLPGQGDAAHSAPFFAGYPSDDKIVVQRTRGDPTASRAGMVATTALFIPVEAVPHVDLAAIFALLTREPELKPVDISEIAHLSGDPDTPVAAAAALAAALMQESRALWLGPGAEQAICDLWKRLGPDDRMRLRFGAAFHPGHIPLPDAPMTIIVTPTRYQSRWPDWPVVDSEAEADTPGARALLGLPGAELAVELANELFEGPPPFGEWRLLDAAARYYGHLDAADHEELRALAQLLGRLAPDPEQGLTVKSRVMATLAKRSHRATAADVRGLKAIPWKALGANGPESLIATWADAVIRDPRRAPQLIDLLDPDSTEDAHDKAVLRALMTAVHDQPTPALQHTVALSQRVDGREAFEWLIQQLDPDAVDVELSGRDELMMASDWLVESALRFSLSRTYAALADTSDAVSAWRALLGLDTTTLEAEELLAKRMGPRDLVDAARALDAAPLTARAASVLDADPSLLVNGDVADRGVRRLLAAMIQMGADPWRVVQPRVAADTLVSLISSGEQVDETLLSAISETSAADISAHPQRASVWKGLPREARHRMLAATAFTVAQTLTREHPPPEPELAAAMLNADVLGSVAHDDPAQSLLLLEHIKNARAEDAMTVLQRARFATRDAEQLGDLIVRRRWKAAALAIAQSISGRPDLQPAATKVAKLFGLRERIELFFTGLGDVKPLATPKELRDLLQEVVVDLYPQGPGDDSIWERAGGDAADMPSGKTGRRAWARALQEIKAGSRGAPSQGDLLDAILEDHPRNTTLSAVADALRKSNR